MDTHTHQIIEKRTGQITYSCSIRHEGEIVAGGLGQTEPEAKAVAMEEFGYLKQLGYI